MNIEIEKIVVLAPGKVLAIFSDGAAVDLNEMPVTDYLEDFINENAGNPDRKREVNAASQEYRRRYDRAVKAARELRRKNAEWLGRPLVTMPTIKPWKSTNGIEKTLLVSILQTAKVQEDGSIASDLGLMTVKKLPIGNSEWLIVDNHSKVEWRKHNVNGGLIRSLLNKYYSFYYY